jgi:hypothetical protein
LPAGGTGNHGGGVGEVVVESMRTAAVMSMILLW